MRILRTSDWVGCAYFSYLLIAAGVLPLSRGRRLRIITVATTALAAVVVVAQLTSERLPSIVHDAAPSAYLLLGYWLSGLFFSRPQQRLERWLGGLDARLFAAGRIEEFVAWAPRPLLEYFEFSYFLCYLVVPGGFLTLYLTGSGADIDRFWTVVLTAGFACYGCLPWLQTRPPRALEGMSPMDRRELWFRKLNLKVLEDASIQLNTFPSGHAAAAVATALAVAGVLPAAGMVLDVLAVTIALASVLGRYHYAADAVTGALVALGAFVLWR